MPNDNYYWLFSAAAQSIAALVAFLIAGITLAFSMMDRLLDQDDTLTEIIESLRHRQYKLLRILAFGTIGAIILSLLAVYVNPIDTYARMFVRIFAVINDIFVIIFSAFFVIAIIHPDKYKKTALREYSELKKGIRFPPGQEPAQVFFREFIDLEQDIRLFIEDIKLNIPISNAPRGNISFRQMVITLFQREIISHDLVNMLLETNRYRNLLFHGQMTDVDEGVIKLLRDTRTRWEAEKSGFRNE